MKNYRDTDDELKQSVRRPDAPQDLHAGIMSAVRATARPVKAERRASALDWCWLAAPAMALVMIGAWLVWQGTHPRPTLDQAAMVAQAVSVLQTGDELKREVPAAALAPMSKEWADIQQDLDNTEKFLLASVP